MYLEIPNRLPEEEITQQHKDLASTVQVIYEKYFFKLSITEGLSITLCNPSNNCWSIGFLSESRSFSLST